MNVTQFIKPLSKKQASIVVFIHDYIQTNDYPPTQQEMREFMGISSVSHQITLIIKKGWLSREDNSRYRNIYLTDKGKNRVDTLRTESNVDIDSS